jgi:DNA-binding transcriptional ArsR family regulator
LIRAQLEAATVEHVAVAHSPLTECVLSLRLRLQGRPHPLQQPWARAMRRLPRPLLESIARLGFVFDGNAPALIGPTRGGFEAFTAELDRLRSMPPSAVRYQFTWGLHRGRLTPAELEDPNIRRWLRESAAHDLRVDDLELALEQPEVFLKAFTELIEHYFERAFVKEWERVEPLLAESVAAAARQIASVGLFEALPSLSPRLRANACHREILIEKAIDRTWKLRADDVLVFSPSFYAWPNLIVTLAEDHWPKAIVYPAPFLGDYTIEPPPPDALVRVLRALGDGTRLRVLRLVTDKPRSTQELAPLLGISEGTLSRHLRGLSDAGLLSRRREGKFVLYAPQKENLNHVAPSLRRYLQCRGDDSR